MPVVLVRRADDGFVIDRRALPTTETQQIADFARRQTAAHDRGQRVSGTFNTEIATIH